MRIKLYENRDFMRRTQIKLMQEEVHIWCIRWRNYRYPETDSEDTWRLFI